MPVSITNSGIVLPSGSLSGAQSAGAYKNLIMNGDFRVHQRVNSTYSLTSSTDGRFFDRWRCFLPAGRTATLSRRAENQFPGFYFRRTIDTVSSSSNAYDIIATQYITSGMVSKLSTGSYTANPNGLFTVNFWVRSSITGTASVAINMINNTNGFNRWAYGTYNIIESNTWEYKSVVFSAADTFNSDSPPYSSIDVPTTIHDMILHFVGYGGAYGSATSHDSNSYTNYNSFMHSQIKLTRNGGNTNFHNTPGATFDLARIQLESGDTSSSFSDFEFVPYALELRRCQRHFQKSYPQNVAPGTATFAGANILRFGTTTNWTGYYPVQFRGGRMHVMPVMTIYDLAGNAGRLTMDGTHNALSSSISGTGEASTMVYSLDSPISAHYGLWFHWTAFADY